ncbi:MAG: putative rRNA maturation factor [Candidatus Curtissbacteria bacterium GW2011_GWA1_40_16]|uniref:Putative rRNA maturation factor n=1 Tax=Candidatus Curtissbacteria bacterium GW2011_GWA1_40_16 TaxID=1618405 RepID=A0A0G0TVV4_9BACT|nr:MAG: putative rRNA maturation factor [Candidatus Curtissbacteria bacterium GW2011_GWA1_40_16]
MVKTLIFSDTRYPVNRKIVRKAVADTFLKYKIEATIAEVSVAVVGSRKMKDLTDKFMKDGKEHEVLSFPLEELTAGFASGFAGSPDDVLRLGDVVLCWPQVLEAASRDDIMVDEEVYKLTCHGIEHLLGQHHE